MIFPDTAPDFVSLYARGPVLFCDRQYTYQEAMQLHHDLGQTLARMMRKRGAVNAALSTKSYLRHIQTINDNKGHAATVAAMDKAIEKMQAAFKKEQKNC